VKSSSSSAVQTSFNVIAFKVISSVLSAVTLNLAINTFSSQILTSEADQLASTVNCQAS
jgi:hypothetical protein